MRYFWFVIFVLSGGSVSAQNSARVRELEKQRKAALAEIEMTSQLLDETRQTARNSLNRLNLLSKQILSRKQVISLLNQEIGEIDKQIAASRRNISQLERELENSGLIYVYQEGGEGKWYVYERSAYFLSRMMEGVVLERYVMDNTLWLVRAEVDVDCIPHDTILSYLKTGFRNGYRKLKE